MANNSDVDNFGRLWEPTDPPSLDPYAAQPCKLCPNLCEVGEDALQCGLCYLWSHRKCLGKGYTVAIYKVLTNCKECRWYCVDCCTKVDDNHAQLNKQENMIKQVEKKNANLDQRLIIMERRDLKQELRDMIKEMIQTETAEYLQTQQVRAMDAEMVNKAVDERMQRLQSMAQP